MIEAVVDDLKICGAITLTRCSLTRFQDQDGLYECIRAVLHDMLDVVARLDYKIKIGSPVLSQAMLLAYLIRGTQALVLKEHTRARNSFKNYLRLINLGVNIEKILKAAGPLRFVNF